ncbi:hypothetical protein L1987_13725 [Smallanthus sonchifolius]|uniref:Uncharacterized protein n=1 Tax=Smallanthus sonchifolius TaxID=185202 RepID=A0ACB9JJM5_9ASTR|nr:hypothetical protein L1987_13725 [Smallanthus sonchifolius]
MPWKAPSNPKDWNLRELEVSTFLNKGQTRLSLIKVDAKICECGCHDLRSSHDVKSLLARTLESSGIWQDYARDIGHDFTWTQRPRNDLCKDLGSLSIMEVFLITLASKEKVRRRFLEACTTSVMEACRGKSSAFAGFASVGLRLPFRYFCCALLLYSVLLLSRSGGARWVRWVGVRVAGVWRGKSRRVGCGVWSD